MISYHIYILKSKLNSNLRYNVWVYKQALIHTTIDFSLKLSTPHCWIKRGIYKVSYGLLDLLGFSGPRLFVRSGPEMDSSVHGPLDLGWDVVPTIYKLSVYK